MAASTARAVSEASGGKAGGGGLMGVFGGLGKGGRLMEKIKAKRAEKQKLRDDAFATRVQGVGVAPHGDEAHTGAGGEGVEAMSPEQEAMAAAPMGYKMPASGAKYGNSPINKNYGSPAQRGFHTPNKLKTFGVGGSNKEKMGGVGSNLLDK